MFITTLVSTSRIKSILIHKYQHNQDESTRINASLTRINTNQHESDTSQHEFDMSHHESNTNQHESDTNQLESTQVKKCPSLVNMSQRKSDTSLTQVNLS